jgi:hypothetical protein
LAVVMEGWFEAIGKHAIILVVRCFARVVRLFARVVRCFSRVVRRCVLRR